MQLERHERGIHALWPGTSGTGVDDGKCAYGSAAAGQFGNASIATEQAPSFFDFDATIGKRFQLAEKKSIDFRAELFNIFNHTQFLGPSGISSFNPVTHVSTTGTFGQVSAAAPPRIGQLALKLSF